MVEKTLKKNDIEFNVNNQHVQCLAHVINLAVQKILQTLNAENNIIQDDSSILQDDNNILQDDSNILQDDTNIIAGLLFKVSLILFLFK